MNNIVWKNADGSISVTYLVEAQNADLHAEELQFNGDIPADSEMVAKNIDIPTDREFRGAWAWITEDPVIDIDMDKAVEVTKIRLRQERQPHLAKLDTEYLKADEDGNTTEKKRIKTEKQRLRDITSLVNNNMSLEEMKGVKVNG